MTSAQASHPKITTITSPPASPQTPKQATLQGLSPLLHFVKPYQGKVFLAFSLLIAASVAMLFVPYLFKDLIDQFVAGKVHLVNSTFLWLVVIALVWSSLVAARFYLMSWLGERVTADVRSAVYENVIKQPPSFFETLQTGEVLSRLAGDTTLVQTVIGSSLSMGLRSVIQLTGGMIMLAITSFWLFGINILILLLLVIPILIAGRKVKKLSRDSQDRLADASALAAERINAATTVQSFARETYEAQLFTERANATFNTAIRRSKMRAYLVGATISATFLAITFVLWLGTRSVVAGTMTAGQLASFVMYAMIAAGSVGVIAEVWSEIQRAAGATERLVELLKPYESTSTIQTGSSAATLAEQAVRLREKNGATLSVRNLSFSYPSRPLEQALSDVSFEVKAGQTVAIVGASGSGKSTLLQLLQCFYPIATASVFISDVDIAATNPQFLREAIAVVPQEPVIFSGSVYDNVRYGRLNATDAEIEAAVHAAAATEFVEKLPDGFKSYLGERGVRLSGGQRQRIAIARAILKDAPLLLLDEATSALDTESEGLVRQGLEAARKHRTTLIVAHRLSTIMDADHVIVLNAGKVVESGSPKELMQNNSKFAGMVQAQAFNSYAG
jgi:ATP-binding cassette, subfamily B, bacterial